MTGDEIEKGVYLHVKSGNKYEVIGTALQKETAEKLVIYRPLYERDDNYELFARPYGMFTGLIDLNGVIMPRFKKVDD